MRLIGLVLTFAVGLVLAPLAPEAQQANVYRLGTISILVAELIALKPDVIVVDTTPGAIAAMQATAAIPIVMFNVSDPVDTGLVASLARPDGNVTGSTDFGTELAVKAVDLMHAAVPRAARIAIFMSDNPHIVKPVDPAELGVVVSTLVARSLER
ncbi:MAG: hypothetical protein DMD96_04620 [Candidatus Rokuibacteriota bacterium]|nr:MAG: hypothetical protein DMD96_04620 [Candidatus Rokubacteria bacterium]